MTYSKPLKAQLAAFALIFLGYCCIHAAHAGQRIEGKVVGISDGDTITVLDWRKQKHKIRLHQIDAPEKKQAFGMRSKQSLSQLVYGKAVTVDVATTDQYGRAVGKVWVNGTDANLEQVKRGMAWVYRKYAREPAYFAAEKKARNAGVGLWSKPNPIPPWEYRHRTTLETQR